MSKKPDQAPSQDGATFTSKSGSELLPHHMTISDALQEKSSAEIQQMFDQLHAQIEQARQLEDMETLRFLNDRLSILEVKAPPVLLRVQLEEARQALADAEATADDLRRQHTEASNAWRAKVEEREEAARRLTAECEALECENSSLSHQVRRQEEAVKEFCRQLEAAEIAVESMETGVPVETLAAEREQARCEESERMRDEYLEEYRRSVLQSSRPTSRYDITATGPDAHRPSTRVMHSSVR